jgi:cellulose synthase/poly-beta-1,6-N-acetylglucosamine synthase-like glycosyltransferase
VALGRRCGLRFHGREHRRLVLRCVLALVTLVDVGALVALAVAMLRRVRSKASPSTPSVSVLVAARNERDVIERTVRGLLAQGEVEVEVIVADDGSTDGTGTVVERAFRDDPRVRLVRIEHARARLGLRAGRITPSSPRSMRTPPSRWRSLGWRSSVATWSRRRAVLVKDAESTLGRFQFLEYVKTIWIRVAWAELSMLEQLSGAFSIFDAMALERAGGFPFDSLTEDYEISYRLYDEAARTGRTIHIAFVPEARAWTAPPDSSRASWATALARGFSPTLVRTPADRASGAAVRFGLIPPAEVSMP